MILYGELKALVAALDQQSVPYALCGGLAMAVHGSPRATVDIDLLVLPEDVDRALSIARGMGYEWGAHPMTFSAGAVEIRRVSKLAGDDEEPLILDLILVTSSLRPLWEDRKSIPFQDYPLSVLSRDGMIKMKLLRNSDQDRADISKLEE